MEAAVEGYHGSGKQLDTLKCRACMGDEISKVAYHKIHFLEHVLLRLPLCDCCNRAAPEFQPHDSLPERLEVAEEELAMDELSRLWMQMHMSHQGHEGTSSFTNLGGLQSPQ